MNGSNKSKSGGIDEEIFSFEGGVTCVFVIERKLCCKIVMLQHDFLHDNKEKF